MREEIDDHKMKEKRCRRFAKAVTSPRRGQNSERTCLRQVTDLAKILCALEMVNRRQTSKVRERNNAATRDES